MAAVTASNTSIVFNRGPDAAIPAETAPLWTANVYGDNGTTAVVGGTDTLDFALGTIIQNSQRDGKTVTVRAVSIVQSLTQGSTVFAGTISLSGNTASITPKSNTDWSTNASIAASAATRPYGISVTFQES